MHHSVLHAIGEGLYRYAKKSCTQSKAPTVIVNRFLHTNPLPPPDMVEEIFFPFLIQVLL